MSASDVGSTGPIEEPAADFHTERSYLIGSMIGGLTYGIVLSLFIRVVLAVIQRSRAGRQDVGDAQASYGRESLRRRRLRRAGRFKFRRSTYLLAYISTIFILNTLLVGANMLWTQLMFIDNRNFPGGPIAYTRAFFSSPVSNLTNVPFIITTWLADGLMLWRCAVIWKASFLKVVMAFPVLMYMSTLTLGVLAAIQLAQPGLSLWAHGVVNVIVPFFTISLSLNILITALILARLFKHSATVEAALGKSYSKKYQNIMAIIVESALLYAIVSGALMISFLIGSGVQHVFLQSVSQVQVIATFLIVIRVLDGTAVNTEPSSDYGRSRSFGHDLTNSIIVTRTTDVMVAPPLTSIPLSVRRHQERSSGTPNYARYNEARGVSSLPASSVPETFQEGDYKKPYSLTDDMEAADMYVGDPDMAHSLLSGSTLTGNRDSDHLKI